ncbi:MAG: hypothetical protein ABS882_07630, partial [Lysinibacillus sp.]
MRKMYMLLMAMLLVILAACGDDSVSDGGASSGDGDKKIALLMADLGNPFFHVLRDAVVEQGESLGYE